LTASRPEKGNIEYMGRARNTTLKVLDNIEKGVKTGAQSAVTSFDVLAVCKTTISAELRSFFLHDCPCSVEDNVGAVLSM
jgi:hypothetical protein